jgi:hypothetical protein
MICFHSGHPASYPTIREAGLTKLIKEGNHVKIAHNHSKCNVEDNKLATNSVQIRYRDVLAAGMELRYVHLLMPQVLIYISLRMY